MEGSTMKYCRFCGKQIRDTDKFCPSCGNPLQPNEEQKEGSPAEKYENLHKSRRYKRLKLVVALGVATVAFTTVSILYVLITGKQNINSEHQLSVSVTTTDSLTDSGSEKENDLDIKDNENNANNSNICNAFEEYNGQIQYAKYMAEEKGFLLTSDSDEQIIISRDGTEVKDWEDNSQGIVPEASNEEYLGGGSPIMNDRNGVVVTWTKELQSDLSGTVYTLRAYDKSSNVIFKIDSNAAYFKTEGKENLLADLPTYQNVAYVGNGVFNFGSFMVNIDDQKVFDSYGENFENGYGVSVHGIRDVHGNFVINGETNTEFQEIAGYGNFLNQFSNGLFYEGSTQKFYDINLNVVIDFSEYDVYSTNMTFIDGLCAVTIKNPDNVLLYGLIDTKGNWVYGPTDSARELWTFYPYSGRLSKNKILFGTLGAGYQVYDLTDQEFIYLPVSNYDNNDIVVLGGYVYYLTEGKIKCYDIENEEECAFPSEQGLTERIAELNDVINEGNVLTY